MLLTVYGYDPFTTENSTVEFVEFASKPEKNTVQCVPLASPVSVNVTP